MLFRSFPHSFQISAADQMMEGTAFTGPFDVTARISRTGDAIPGKGDLEGTVKGDIHASGRVVLGATARVEGNVYYGVIEMTLGAQIMGKLVRLGPQAPPAGGVRTS